VGAKAMDFAGQNITSSFDFAQKLVRAKESRNARAASVLHQDPDAGAGEQAKELGQSTGKMATDPLKSQH